MSKRNILVGAGVAAALSALAFAHHLPLGLSHSDATEILSEVKFFTNVGTFGVPPYQHGEAEAEHDDTITLAHGDSFSVMDASGSSETIVFESSDFPDIANATFEEVEDVISAKSALVEAFHFNDFVILQGMQGGETASLTVVDGAGSPLSKLGVLPGVSSGSRDLLLDISVPAGPLDGGASGLEHDDDDHGDGDHGLAHAPYVLFVSATPGSFNLLGHEVPIGVDALTVDALIAALNFQLPGFYGWLNDTEDAQVTLAGDLLEQAFAPASYPDALYFSYVVLSEELNEIKYVSNRFTLHFE